MNVAVAFVLTLRALRASSSMSAAAMVLRPVTVTGGAGTLPSEAWTESAGSVRTAADILDEFPAICIFVCAGSGQRDNSVSGQRYNRYSRKHTGQ
jgi:hypothetical protein